MTHKYTNISTSRLGHLTTKLPNTFVHAGLRINTMFYFVSEQLCMFHVPALIGLARSLGRITNDDTPLFLRLFPPPSTTHHSLHSVRVTTTKKSFSKFRSIIPRALSHNIVGNTSLEGRQLLLGSSLTTDNNVSHTTAAADYYFNRVGSSFSSEETWDMRVTQRATHLQFSTAQLQTIVQLVSWR